MLQPFPPHGDRSKHGILRVWRRTITIARPACPGCDWAVHLWESLCVGQESRMGHERGWQVIDQPLCIEPVRCNSALTPV